MIDRVARARAREVYEVPVGFKWFVGGLLDGTLGFAGEESAGATCLQLDGQPWTTDKDGIVPALLSAEIMTRTGRDPAELYRGLAHRFGAPAERRVQAAATREQRALLARLTPHQFTHTELAGEAIVRILDRAPGNRAAIGGIKVMTEHGWFVARPSGTEDLYRIYAESFNGEEHVASIVADAQSMVDAVLEAGTHHAGGGPHPGYAHRPAAAQASSFSARSQTFSTVKPKSRINSAPGADAPKPATPSTSPRSPT